VSVQSRASRVMPLIVGAIVGAGVFACSGSGGGDGGGGGDQRTDQGGVPAPPAALTNESPVTDFLAYGDSLQFATTAPGQLLVQKTVGGNASTLRVRSELRLPNTIDSAYVRGRIIARFETEGAPSTYGVPVGHAYLWVQKVGSNHVGTLVYRSSAGDTGRVSIAEMHSSPREVPGGTIECIDLDVTSDTTRVCCLCGTSQYNCPMLAEISAHRLDSLLTARGKPRKAP
jgi:hypothetical protein